MHPKSFVSNFWGAVHFPAGVIFILILKGQRENGPRGQSRLAHGVSPLWIFHTD